MNAVKRAIIWFIVWASVVVLFKWFISELFVLFTPFLILAPIGILVICTIAFVVWGIVLLIKNRKTQRMEAAIPLFLLIAVILMVIFVPFAPLKIGFEHKLYSEKRMEIVSMIQSKELFADETGRLELPSGYRYLSCDGDINIYKNDSEETIIGFWTFVALHMNPYEAVVYTSQAVAPTENTLDCMILYEVKQLDPHWYYIRAK